MKTYFPSAKLIFWFLLLSVCSLGAAAFPSTQPAPTVQTERMIFAVIGDFGLASQSEADVSNLVKSWAPDFIITVGDNNYPHGAADTIDSNIGQYYHDYIFPYRGKYGAGAPYKKFYPVLGNHDWDTNDAQAYFNYFSFYNDIGYYDLIKGPVHFFMLDSDPSEPDGTSVTSEQAKWLRKGLAASTSDFNIVVFHHAPYSSGKHGSTTYMQWPFEAWGADAVLSGHDHIYERFNIDGIPYIVNGLGGEELYPYSTILPGSQIRFNTDFGAMRVEVGNLSMKFQFLTRAGTLIDEYTINKSFPVVSSITRATPSPSNSQNVDFQVTFSEPVTGVDPSDFILSTSGLSGTLVSSVSGSGNLYTVSADTGTGGGSIRLDLIDNDSILNTFGNPLGKSGSGNGSYVNGETYGIDKNAPATASVSLLSPNPSNAGSVEFLVTFSESVSGVDSSDFSTTSTMGASVSNVNGADNLYTVSVRTTAGVDNLHLNIADNDSITDSAGNPLGGYGVGNGNFLSAGAYQMDRVTPSVTSIIRAGSNPSSAAGVDFIVTFSEPVSGLDASDFSLSSTNLSGAAVTTINNMNPFYIVTVSTGSGTGTIRLDLIDDDSITDSAGNPPGGPGVGNGNYITGETYSIEKSFPIATSIIRSGLNPASTASVDFIVTFSESVSGVDSSDFGLTSTDLLNPSIIKVTNVDPFYIVSVNTGAGTGTLRLDLIDDGSIENSSGSNLGGAGATNGNFNSGETFNISKATVNFSAPSLRDPRQNFLTNSSTPFFSWDKVRGASQYEITIALDSIFSQIFASQVVSGTSYPSTLALDDNTYYWRVRAYNSANQPGKYSTTNKFTIDTTPPPAPTLLSPADKSMITKTNFVWGKIGEATKYQIEIDTNADFSSPEWSSLRNDPSYQVSNMHRGTYFWHVRAKDAAGNWGDWSLIFSVKFP
jgi:tartrate-resistant acid phosphatase type 5